MFNSMGIALQYVEGSGKKATVNIIINNKVMHHRSRTPIYLLFISKSIFNFQLRVHTPDVSVIDIRV